MFGFAESLHGELAILPTPIPSESLLMAPNVVTLGVVVGRSRALGRSAQERSVVTGIDWVGLRAAADEAGRAAYAPYSGLRVGAAALVDDGRVVTGCNVENASFGLTLCAECGLVSELHRSGGGRLVAFACRDVDGERLLMPCGRCRQLLWEAGGPDLLVDTLAGPTPMADVLPFAFGADELPARPSGGSTP